MKTDEANLSRIYGKLDVGSRTELANRLQARDSGRTQSPNVPARQR